MVVYIIEQIHKFNYQSDIYAIYESRQDAIQHLKQLNDKYEYDYNYSLEEYEVTEKQS